MNHILDSDAELAFEVDAGLGGDDAVFYEFVLVACADAGGFVDL